MADNEQNQPTQTGYEKGDANPVKIIGYGLGGVVLIAIILVFVYQLFLSTSEELVDEVVLKPQSTAIRELRAREDKELNSYKLLDPEKKIYRIPIDRAIKLMADEAYLKRTNSTKKNQQGK
jgi:hypothetical protein